MAGCGVRRRTWATTAAAVASLLVPVGCAKAPEPDALTTATTRASAGGTSPTAPTSTTPPSPTSARAGGSTSTPGGPAGTSNPEADTVAKASDYNIDITDCSEDDQGTLQASGTITNRSPDVHAFTLTVQFIDSDGNVIDTAEHVTTPSLAPGARGPWNAASFDLESGGLRCNITRVAYFDA